MPSRCIRTLMCIIIICGCALLSGCMQVETHIKLNPDGSAEITERMRFSRRLLAYGDRSGKELNVARFLKKEAALKRMASMGEGLSLAEYNVSDKPNGDRESIATFKTADINTFRYVSPWFGYLDYPANNAVKCVLSPAYKSGVYTLAVAGTMSVNFIHLKGGRLPPRRDKNAPVPKGPSPREMQAYRNLGPLFKDALRGFHVKLTFESYAPIRKSKLGRYAGKQIDLIDFSWENRDAYDQPFLENEEVMLDLLRGDMSSSDILAHVKDAHNNATLPVFVPLASAKSVIPFAPSRFLFDKYFKGKKLDYSVWGPSPPEKHVPAVFEKIGWNGDKGGK